MQYLNNLLNNLKDTKTLIILVLVIIKLIPMVWFASKLFIRYNATQAISEKIRQWKSPSIQLKK